MALKIKLSYKFFLFSVIIFKPHCLTSQEINNSFIKPKLVVGIVIDQMRNDFIYRYWNRYCNGGFKKLINEGYYFKNAHYNFIPTYTAPGHSCVYTGTTPRTNGIIGNNWYDKKTGSILYCVYDSLVKPVGTKNKNGLMSPKRLLSSTIGDELKMSSANRAKVFSIALKDRSAVIPAGHSADGAFWFDDETSNFISSSWFMNSLPSWVNAFNAKKIARVLLEKKWTTLYPIETYTSSINDDNKYELSLTKNEPPIFPYDYSRFLEKSNFSILKTSPFGNIITKDLAIECIKNEQLGKDDVSDLLCISFSSPDYIGHSFGPRSVEAEDLYLRLDKDIEELLDALDKEVGKNNYTVFLTADHGGADIPNHLIDNKIPAGYVNETKIATEVKKYFHETYKDSLIFLNISNEQIFLNEKLIKNLNYNKHELEKKLADFLITLNGISEAFSSDDLKNESYKSNDYRALLQNGFNHKLSGNVCFIYQPGWMDYAAKGTTHGAGYNYDTHVPVIFYGQGIIKGEAYNYISITQIAPTICELLKINQTNSTHSEPLNTFFKSNK